jgi:hypothetical protein
VVNPNGTLANVFVYIRQGLEGKAFGPPVEPVVIDQSGCWFKPRVFGIQTGQLLNVTNSDPVTHNIHPLAQVNRAWNQSQEPGSEPLKRRFKAREVQYPFVDARLDRRRGAPLLRRHRRCGHFRN